MTTDPHTRDQFVILEDTTDEELTWLYQHCAFTVYPSFYEGWGLPIAESLAHGIPCLSSNTSSMPEIAADLMSFFDPASTDECLGAIQGLLDPAGYELAVSRAKQYKITTWNTTFDQVTTLIRSPK